MPAKDIYHDTVKHALVKDGWTITKEQFKLPSPNRNLWVDMRAEKESASRVILVEVKSFENVSSPIEYASAAVGKYLLYRTILTHAEIDIPLFLAVPRSAWEGIFSEPVGQLFIEEFDIAFLVFDVEAQEIIKWTT
jgi:hypothetical protein